MNLKDTVALVTGGGSGLGEATIREFAGAGARVAILDLAASPGAKVAESLGDKAIFVAADVVAEDQVKDAVAQTDAKYGGVHAAGSWEGTGRAGRALSRGDPHPLERFNKVIQVNRVGTFNAIRLAAAAMAKKQPNADGERGV